jgi:hypothetical protein
MKKLVEGPFGIRMKDDQARNLEGLLKRLPKECRSLRRKAAVPESTELQAGERADISLVSVEKVDREGEVVKAKGVDLAHFQANPVVCFAHRYDDLPVGKCQWIKQVPGGIKAKTIYSEATEMSRAVWQMTREGVLSGKSIGFIPTMMRPPNPDEPHWKHAAAVVESSVLLEYSVAPVPICAEALVEAVSKGLADEATLNKLGLAVPRKVDDLGLLLKALEKVRIDPEKIAARVLDSYRTRGRV